MKRYGLFCSFGLGDGLIALIIAHNLKREGVEVRVFHDLLIQMQDWFPGISIEKYPSSEKVKDLVDLFDVCIINADHTSMNRAVQKEADAKGCLLLPSTRKKQAGDFLFNRDISMAENLLLFCQEKCSIAMPVKANGLVPKDTLGYRKHSKRVVIHPTSRSKDRNWTKSKFIQLAKWLQKTGFTPVFVMTEEERQDWKDDQFSFLVCRHLDELSSYIYESGYCIGNDSGIGHLASALKIPTLTIFRSQRKKSLWKPDFYMNIGIAPWPLLPHIKGLRLRDKYWQVMVETWRVKRAFKRLVKDCP